MSAPANDLRQYTILELLRQAARLLPPGHVIKIDGPEIRAVIRQTDTALRMAPDAGLDPPPLLTKPPLPRPPTRGCGADVWRVLTEVAGRLTLGEVMEELAERGKEWDERTVRRHLKRLQEAGLVDHDDRARPPGYGVNGGSFSTH